MHIGIDLGTSNSSVAVYLGSGPQIVPASEGEDILPSVVYVDTSGNRLFGRRAYEQTVLEPRNVAAGFKRLMGTSTPIRLEDAGLSMTAEQASAEIIRQLMTQVFAAYPDEAIDGCVITVPAAFNQMQNESTQRAAELAGIDRVALLQEPTAAAMAAVAEAGSASGLFLVYDLGGGTFDLALVQSVSGTINVLDNLGINMLGGRDFDHEVIVSHVLPWLQREFVLPEDFSKQPAYGRLLRVAQLAVERAKIELSEHDTATVIASAEEISTRDGSGVPIHLDVDLSRDRFEAMIAGRVDETIAQCRQILAINGYTADQVDRIVFIGGPCRTPWLRERVAAALGIRGDFSVDPMTAVSTGAAIYAESREWEGGSSRRKRARSSARAGSLGIEYSYTGRTTRDSVKLTATAVAELSDGKELQIDSAKGWTSGRLSLQSGTASVRLPVADHGSNHFRISVFDADGRFLADAESRIEIVRSHASINGIPAAHTLSAKVVEGDEQSLRNVLEPMVEKGTLLPANGVKRFRAARTLRGGESDAIDLELYQQNEGVKTLDASLPIGAFRIGGNDLLPGMVIRPGDEIVCQWTMSDSGILRVVIDVPSIGQTFDTGHLYADSAGHRDYRGEQGEALLLSVLDDANKALAEAREVLQGHGDRELSEIGAELQNQRRSLARSADPEQRRSIAERVRHLRQRLSRVLEAPEHRERTLRSRLARVKETHATLSQDTPPDAVERERFERLTKNVEAALAAGRHEHGRDVDRLLDEMSQIVSDQMFARPDIVVSMFRAVSADRATAIDAELHDSLVARGNQAMSDNQIGILRGVVSQLYGNQAQPNMQAVMADELSGLRRA